jgi:hypothetical protein
MRLNDQIRISLSVLEEGSKFPTGVGQIDRGQCKIGRSNPMACMFCSYGHVLECHYPHTCEEVECSHYEMAMRNEIEDKE